ncbi:MAG: hypothetical protein V4591_11225, partial [Bdellovibrionota bacterium]
KAKKEALRSEVEVRDVVGNYHRHVNEIFGDLFGAESRRINIILKRLELSINALHQELGHNQNLDQLFREQVTSNLSPANRLIKVAQAYIDLSCESKNGPQETAVYECLILQCYALDLEPSVGRLNLKELNKHCEGFSPENKERIEILENIRNGRPLVIRANVEHLDDTKELDVKSPPKRLKKQRVRKKSINNSVQKAQEVLNDPNNVLTCTAHYPQSVKGQPVANFPEVDEGDPLIWRNIPA